MTETDRPLAPLITMTESERALAESKGESAAFRAELGLMSNTERNVVVLLRRSLAELDAQRAARATAYAEGQRDANAKYAYTLRNAYMLARREAAREQKEDNTRSSRWNHIIRFCKDADVDGAITASSVLRDAPAPRPAPAPTAQQGDSE